MLRVVEEFLLAEKAALAALVMGKELAQFNIAVTAVARGSFRLQLVREKIAALSAQIDAWEAVSTSTDTLTA